MNMALFVDGVIVVDILFEGLFLLVEETVFVGPRVASVRYGAELIHRP